MTGMGNGVSLRNPTVTSHFVSALFFDLACVIGLSAIAAVTVMLVRRGAEQSLAEPEPPARRLLRLGVGTLWVVAGLLQLQTSMPMGLPVAVVRPAVATAPTWGSWAALQATDAWIRHPILGATSVVWIELGLGAWILLARRGWWSAAAGAASAAWALVIFVIGSGFGGVFLAPWSWVFGAPGASLLYLVAGLALTIPSSRLASASVARIVARVLGVILIVLGVHQALPSSGVVRSGRSSSLAVMADQMAAMSQPAATASIERWFSSVAVHAGPLLGLFVVIVLVVTGAALVSCRPNLIGPAAIGFSFTAALVWVFVQDFGVLGGSSTDVNSMPMWVLLILVTRRLIIDSAQPAPTGPAVLESPGTQRRIAASVSAAAVTAFGVVLLATMAILPGSTADASIAAGAQVSALRGPAPPFVLTDSLGQRVSLSDFAGRVVVISFIDPVCTSECPIEAQEMHLAAEQLGSDAKVSFVAINANPHFTSVSDLQAFNDAEGLTRWTNWTYLTGSVADLRDVWNRYGVSVSTIGAGGMELHSESVFIIDRGGQLRATWTLASGDGPSSVEGQSTTSQLVDQIRRAS